MARARVPSARRSRGAGITPRDRRNALIASHIVLVERIASKMIARLPPQLERDELQSAGFLGLVEAADAFDLRRGVPFGAYARRRIIGAILDHLRATDPLTRTDRRAVREGRAVCPHDVQLPTGPAIEELLPFISTEPAADDVLIAQTQAARLHRAIERLPTREAYIVREHGLRERTLAELARDLGVGEARVSQLKQRAFQRLRQWLVS